MNEPQKLPSYPLVAVLARDWALYAEQYPVTKKFSACLSWVIGFLIKEAGDSLVISSEFFPAQDDNEIRVRYTQVIPKENVVQTMYLTKLAGMPEGV